MPRLHVTLLMVVIVCLSVWTAYAQGQRTGPPRQTWEYRVVETQFLESYMSAADVQQLLNQGGADGWELMRIDEKRFYFKRPK
jgi:hypothetical protein